MLHRRRLLTIAAAGVLVPVLPTRSAQAQAWPNRFVRVIVPFAAGGATDVIARTIGQRLSEVWGQQVVIETRGGAGGNIGAQMAAQSDPDGYTLLISSVGQAVNRFLYPSLGYDPIADFAPVTLICLQPNIMVVPNSSPAKSVAEFIAHARANPGKLSYGSGVNGTSVHLCGELFKRVTGIDMRRADDAGDRREIADQVEIELVVECRIGGVAGPDHEQRVAVRGRLCGRLGADIGAAARPVLDHELLAEPF